MSTSLPDVDTKVHSSSHMNTLASNGLNGDPMLPLGFACPYHHYK